MLKLTYTQQNKTNRVYKLTVKIKCNHKNAPTKEGRRVQREQRTSETKNK